MSSTKHLNFTLATPLIVASRIPPTLQISILLGFFKSVVDDFWIFKIAIFKGSDTYVTIFVELEKHKEITLSIYSRPNGEKSTSIFVLLESLYENIRFSTRFVGPQVILHNCYFYLCVFCYWGKVQSLFYLFYWCGGMVILPA